MTECTSGVRNLQDVSGTSCASKQECYQRLMAHVKEIQESTWKSALYKDGEFLAPEALACPIEWKTLVI